MKGICGLIKSEEDNWGLEPSGDSLMDRKVDDHHLYGLPAATVPILCSSEPMLARKERSIIYSKRDIEVHQLRKTIAEDISTSALLQYKRNAEP